MAPSAPRARHVQLDVASGRLFVVYPQDASMESLNAIAEAFQAETNVQARAGRGRFDNETEKLPFIMIQPVSGPNAERAFARLKELTDPVLPIAIEVLDLGLWICSCHYISSWLKHLGFVPGLGPDDVEMFKLHYYAALSKLPVAALMDAGSSASPFGPLMNGLHELLEGLGAYPTEVRITPSADPRPCTHSE